MVLALLETRDIKDLGVPLGDAAKLVEIAKRLKTTVDVRSPQQQQSKPDDSVAKTFAKSAGKSMGSELGKGLAKAIF